MSPILTNTLVVNLKTLPKLEGIFLPHTYISMNFKLKMS